jgi:hypothetical protein
MSFLIKSKSLPFFTPNQDFHKRPKFDLIDPIDYNKMLAVLNRGTPAPT